MVSVIDNLSDKRARPVTLELVDSLMQSDTKSTKCNVWSARNGEFEDGTMATTARTFHGTNVSSGKIFDKMREAANKTTQPTTPTNHLMWNINDVHVGYNKDQAKQFKLEGR